jgi:hypothetical protein
MSPYLLSDHFKSAKMLESLTIGNTEMILMLLAAITVLVVIRLDQIGRRLEQDADESALNLESQARFGRMKNKIVGINDWRKRTFLLKVK